MVLVSLSKELLVEASTPVETEERRGGRRWERVLPTDPPPQRSLAAVASATCQATPGSPVLSGDTEYEEPLCCGSFCNVKNRSDCRTNGFRFLVNVRRRKECKTGFGINIHV